MYLLEVDQKKSPVCPISCISFIVNNNRIIVAFSTLSLMDSIFDRNLTRRFGLPSTWRKAKVPQTREWHVTSSKKSSVSANQIALLSKCYNQSRTPWTFHAIIRQSNFWSLRSALIMRIWRHIGQDHYFASLAGTETSTVSCSWLHIKAHRQKGLSEDVSMRKFLDDDTRGGQLQALQKQDPME